MRCVIVIPTYNERENITDLLLALRSRLPDTDVLVVDDASPDGTGDLVAEAATRDPGVQLLRRAGKEGLGSAYRAGFARVLAAGYEAIVSMDADFSHDPASIPEMLALLDAGADAVVGSRYVPGGATAHWPWYRRALSRWGNRYTSLVLGLQVRDCTSGFRVYRRDALAGIDAASTRAEGYAFLTELVRRLVRRGYRVMESPIVFADRRYGTSKMSSRIIVESMALVTKWGIRDTVSGARRVNPPVRH